MRFVVGLVLSVLAYDWADDKLKAAGLSWASVGAAVGSLLALTFIGALIVAQDRKAREAKRQAAERIEEAEERAEEIRELAADLGYGERVEPDPEPDDHGHLSAEHMIADGLSAPIFLVYCDLRDEETERVVSIERVYATKKKAKATHLRGYCHMARARRTFRIAGIQEAADPQTGRAIANIAAYLTAYRAPIKALPSSAPPLPIAAPVPATEPHQRSWKNISSSAPNSPPMPRPWG